MRKIAAMFALLLPVAWQTTVLAGGDKWKDNTGVLPQYCKDRAAGRDQKWRSTFGDVYIHMHHYCSGVHAEQKARIALNKRERVSWLNRVASQMKYVSASCGSGCVLYPELHTRWAWALGELGQIAEAMKHYQLALRAKQNYTPAYAGLADLYLKANQTEDARKVLERGLKANPKSRVLKKRLDELGSS
jgi:tetratricopeptide (TPR) repeat protein